MDKERGPSDLSQFSIDLSINAGGRSAFRVGQSKLTSPFSETELK